MGWDLAMLLVLFYTAMVAPWQVGFFLRADPDEPLFYVDRCVDLLFIFDLFLSFGRPFLDEASGKTVSHVPSIIRNYLKFWFWIDVISCVPYDMIDWGIATDWGASYFARRRSRIFCDQRTFKYL